MVTRLLDPTCSCRKDSSSPGAAKAELSWMTRELWAAPSSAYRCSQRGTKAACRHAGRQYQSNDIPAALCDFCGHGYEGRRDAVCVLPGCLAGSLLKLRLMMASSACCKDGY